MSRRTLGYAAAFVALAVLVQATDFDRLNQFAVDNLQPVAAGKGHPRLNSLAELVVSPGSPAFSAVLIGAAAALLLARRRPRAAFAWPATLAAALVIEVVCKLAISQHRSGIWHGFGFTFDSSFPSGHMLRAILVAGAWAAVWARLRTPLALWCVTVAGCLLVSGWHLPTDIAGGILAGLALASWASDYEEEPVEADLGAFTNDFSAGTSEHR
jgi:membrane-associated phospholipid phosphatase